MLMPSLQEVEAYGREGKYSLFPVCLEILSDFTTPIEVMRILMNEDEHCFLLESADSSKRWGRYTFLGFEPKMLITASDGIMKVGNREFRTDDPAAEIRKILEEYRSPSVPGLPSFTGGLVGYFSYDYLKYSEPSLHLDAEDTEGFRDIDLMLFDKVIVFDNFAQKLLLIANIPLEGIDLNYSMAEKELRRLETLIKTGKKKPVSGDI